MTDTAAVLARITRLFEDKLQVAVPSADTDLFETGALDSLSFVDLLLEIEREFGLRISLDRVELGAFQTLSRIAAIVAAGRATWRASRSCTSRSCPRSATWRRKSCANSWRGCCCGTRGAPKRSRRWSARTATAKWSAASA